MTVCRCCKDALQSQWRHFLIARKLGTTEFLCRLTTKKSMCFANPVTMKGQWSLLLTRDQIVQQKRPLWRRAPIKQCTCYLSLIILCWHDADMKTTSRKLYWEVNSLWEKRSIKHQNVSAGGVDRRYSDMLIVASFATKLDDATNYFSLLTRTTTFILLPYPLHPFTTTT